MRFKKFESSKYPQVAKLNSRKNLFLLGIILQLEPFNKHLTIRRLLCCGMGN